jgi:hypothetical protein
MECVRNWLSGSPPRAARANTKGTVIFGQMIHPVPFSHLFLRIAKPAFEGEIELLRGI